MLLPTDRLTTNKLRALLYAALLLTLILAVFEGIARLA